MDSAIEKSDTDIVYTIAGYLLDRLKWLNEANYYTQKSTSTIFLGFNNKSGLFRKREMRRAILRAINIPKFVYNINRGNAIVAKRPVPPILLPFTSHVQEEFNLTTSKELLSDSGIDTTLFLNYYVPRHAGTRETIFKSIQYFLIKVNIEIKATYFHTWVEHDSACKSKNSQLFQNGWQDDFIGDPWHFLYSMFYSKSSNNVLNYENPDVDRWLDQAITELDDTKRYKLYEKVVNQIIEDTPAVFLYHVIPHFAYNHHKIKKMIVNPYNIVQYHKLELY